MSARVLDDPSRFATMTSEAITAQRLFKRFRIPHERSLTLRGAFVNLFNKTTYEEFNALEDVSFSVRRGEFVGIIGRNGSGKSTLMKLLAGVYSLDSGRLEVRDRVSPFLALGIGFNPELSGKDNVYLNGAILGLTRKQISERFSDILAFSGLERFIDQKLKRYSSGMHARLAFSVLVHAERELLLMDEVLAVGDEQFQQKCFATFDQYKQEGKTIILVTHDLDTVAEKCDRALLLEGGKLIFDGAADVAVEQYRQSAEGLSG